MLNVGITNKLVTNKYHKQAVLRLVRPALRLIRLLWWVFRSFTFRKYCDSAILADNFCTGVGLQDAHAESSVDIPPLDRIKHGISL